MTPHWPAPAGRYTASARLPDEGELPSFGGVPLPCPRSTVMAAAARRGQTSREESGADAMPERSRRGPRRIAPQRLARTGIVRALPYALVIAGLVYGGVLLGTGLTSLQRDRALVAQLRRHGQAATAVVSGWAPVALAGGPQASFGFRVSPGRLALTADTPFDGTLSVPPPAGDTTRHVAVRYDPADVGAVLPAAVVAHPSYARETALAAGGAGLTVVALALGTWWWRRDRRRRARRTTLIFEALLAAPGEALVSPGAESPPARGNTGRSW